MPVDPAREAARWRLQALAVASSGPLIGGLYALGCNVWPLLGLHGLAAFAAWRLWRRPGGGGRELGLQAASLLLCFPVVGSPCAWLIFGRIGRRKTELVDAYGRYVAYGHREPLQLRSIDLRARLLREVGVMPLRDQLGQGDIAAKQSAAAALAQMPGALGVKVLRQALTHPADDTRLLASLALLRKEEELVSGLNRARGACQGVQVPEAAWCELAAVARRYAESGLPAPKAAEGYWQECERAACQALERPGAHAVEAWQAVAASRAGRADWPGALAACEAVLADEPGQVEAAALRCEALFALGRLDELAEASRPLAAAGDWQELAAYWDGLHGR